MLPIIVPVPVVVKKAAANCSIINGLRIWKGLSVHNGGINVMERNNVFTFSSAGIAREPKISGNKTEDSRSWFRGEPIGNIISIKVTMISIAVLIFPVVFMLYLIS
jgi:hypothetical protein